VPLAVVLYDREWRKWVVEKQKEEGTLAEWDVAIIFSGGNTTIDAIGDILRDSFPIAPYDALCPLLLHLALVRTKQSHNCVDRRVPT
jgi:hypothetical protein